MKQKKIPWDAIAAYLKKQASDTQKQLIKEWIVASPENSSIFDQIIRAWQLSRNEITI